MGVLFRQLQRLAQMCHVLVPRKARLVRCDLEQNPVCCADRGSAGASRRTGHPVLCLRRHRGHVVQAFDLCEHGISAARVFLLATNIGGTIMSMNADNVALTIVRGVTMTHG